MARTQIVQWVFLPAGLTADGQLAASLFVAPRLRTDEGSTLADFPDFLDWPQQLAHGLSVTVQRGDGATEAPMQTTVGASSELWRALFPPTTPVRPYRFDDYADRPIVTFPVLEVLDHLRERYASLAFQAIDDLPLATSNASPIGPPLDLSGRVSRPVLASHFETLRIANSAGVLEGVEDEDDFSRRLEETLRASARTAAALRATRSLTPRPMLAPFELSAGTPGAFYKLMGFHRRPQATPASFPAEEDDAVAEIEEKMEFHHLLSSLGDHPTLLRALGLVVDLTIRPDFVPVTQDHDAAGRLRALVARSSSFPPREAPTQATWSVDVSPWTLSRLTLIEGQAFFSAGERPGGPRRFVHGFLRMDPSRHAAIAVDVDGLALKALGMAATLTQQEDATQRPIEEPGEAGVPTVRTGGVALVSTGHGEELHADFYRARGNDDALERLDPAEPPTLAAEDLVRGLRMDVFDTTSGAWRSLHERVVTYRPLRDGRNELELEVEDEGTMQVSVTGAVDRPDAPADPDGALYAHEALVTWDGWSLAAPRPGSAVAQEPAVPRGAADRGPLQLGIDVGARPGSLPRQRFGHGYRLRVRTVDLAGNSHAREPADGLTRTLDGWGVAGPVSVPREPLVLHRFESVPPPELVPRRRFGPGEGLERLVVRSDVDRSAEAYARASEGAADVTLRFVPYCDRHVAPAKASLQLVELHGMLDHAIDTVAGLTHAEATAAISDLHDVASRESGSFLQVAGARLEPTGSHDDEPRGYVVVDADETELPYLPDPACGGVVFRIRFDPEASEETHAIVFPLEGDWFQLQPLRMRLEEGARSEFALGADGRTIVVRLPRGRTATMRLNSLLAFDVPFGLLDWCRSTLTADEAEQVATAVRESRHWMTTPWRTIELVHAVQRPLREPGLELDRGPDGALHRQHDDTVAALGGVVWLDVPSTAQVDMMATWHEVIDDPSAGRLNVDEMEKELREHVFAVTVPEPSGTPWPGEIRDLLAAVEVDAIRFHTETPERETPERVRRRLLSDAAAPGLSVQERNRLAAAAAPLERLKGHDFGDTKYRSVDYHLVASTRFRECFDPLMPAADGSLRGNVERLAILSSAVPPVPAVIDVVPIVGWEVEGGLETERTSVRRGRGLRVWLERPWFATGAGELLGVLCSDSGIVGTNAVGYRKITYVARDPAHGGPVPAPLRAEELVGAVSTLREATVPTPEGPVTGSLAAFEPRYDADRDAWHCDIGIDTGSAYAPFVRLGLVRYQPMSIAGCRFSPLTTTSFIQPLPDRTLVATLRESTISLRLRGPAPTSRRAADGGLSEGTNLVVAVVEEHEPWAHDPEVGWTPVLDEVRLAAALDADGSALWSGEVRLAAETGRARRVRVCEYELHPGEEGDDRARSTRPDARRLVHVDIVPLDA